MGQYKAEMRSKMDCICIDKLEVFARHGVLSEENALGQKFLLSVRMYCDIRQAGKEDDLTKSVNYAEAAWLLKRETEENTFQLIECLAEHLARKLLLTYPLLQKVEIRVEKPWAPIGLPLDNVAVEITRQWHQVYLGIGSNLGERRENLNRAVALLDEDEDTRVERVSSYIETEPLGEVEQGDFLNGAVSVRTLRTPQELLELIGEIEKELKRVRLVHWGPRTIDVDILLYDDEIIRSETLTIPHCEMCRRGFVLEPLQEIAPCAVHPGNGKTIRELWKLLQADS